MISSGISFGEDALFANSLRDCSVKTKTDATLLCIFGEAYRNAMEVSNAKGLQERVEIIKKIYLFSKFFYGNENFQLSQTRINFIIFIKLICLLHLHKNSLSKFLNSSSEFIEFIILLDNI